MARASSFRFRVLVAALVSCLVATFLFLSVSYPRVAFAGDDGSVALRENEFLEEKANDSQEKSEGEKPGSLYVPGWNELDGMKYYADDQGKLVSGWLSDQGKRYYLDPTNGNVAACGFILLQNEIYYFNNDGTLYDKGLLSIEGTWYYAAASGEIETGWLKLGEAWYYLDPAQGGAMLSGSYRVGSTLYHAHQNGALLTGNGWVRTEGSWYYATPSGSLRTGWLKQGGSWYWLDPESGAMATGWYRDGAAWYYSDGSGAMLANRWLKQGGTWYYLNPSGAMRTGWLRDGGSWYWLDRTSGAMATGFVDDGGTAYYCDGSGRMAANRWINESGVWYALSKSGAVRTGWFQEGSARYWLDPQTGAMAVGERTIDGRQYFFSSSGAMVNNVWVSLGNGACGFIDASGEVALVGEYDDQNRIVCLDGQAGWRAVGGKLFYFDPEDKGVLRTGWFEVDGLHYYADASGIKQVGWVSVSGTWYYLDPSNGVMKTGWICVDGTWYYLESTTGAMQTGWLQENGEWYYLKNSGAMTANSSVRISDGTYWYMNGSGRHDRQAGIDIIMRTARSLLGVPYVWLGVYPQDGGMDCASFTWYLYKQLGIDIGFETYDQMHSGVRVFGDAQPGDIILMYYGAWPNYNPILPEHVVLYAGGGMIYEEPTFGGRCQYVSLASKGASTTTVQRILS
ncbi:NlpC/P60 family protein [Paraeggerthella sp. LCP19S3_G8]|uniref:C40 family peptidase n=1 Tax=Paraeggerthella sp. LCP19S3_G8 TaxID=3440248 RepID=UPI003F95CFDE